MHVSQFKSYQFPRACRIRQKEEFDLVLAGKYLTNKWFTVYSSSTDKLVPRLGLIVSKRVIPLSVSRNHVKRIVRETFRLNSKSLPALDFVVRIKRGFGKDSNDEIIAALTSLLLSNKST